MKAYIVILNCHSYDDYYETLFATLSREKAENYKKKFDRLYPLVSSRMSKLKEEEKDKFYWRWFHIGGVYIEEVELR